MKTTVRSKDGGFAQLLRSHKSMAAIIFAIVCIALYLVKNSLGDMGRLLVAPVEGEGALTNYQLLSYFKAGGDASKITWAHAVNNQKFLEDSLKSSKMMLEADVQVDSAGVAIMAHPPAVISDLTLATFLAKVKNSTKGMKLDFKTIEAVEAGMKAVSSMKHEMKGRIWLNADVIKGTLGPQVQVDGDRFLRLAATHCPDCLLSLGWTLSPPQADYKGGYDWDMVRAMRDLLKRNNYNQPVTFAVEATYTVLSVQQLEWLLSQTSQGSLTLWFTKMSQATANDLLCLREKFGKDTIYLDMPSAMQKEFDSLSGCSPN